VSPDPLDTELPVGKLRFYDMEGGRRKSGIGSNAKATRWPEKGKGSNWGKKSWENAGPGRKEKKKGG